jgi:hypothetical protein
MSFVQIFDHETAHIEAMLWKVEDYGEREVQPAEMVAYPTLWACWDKGWELSRGFLEEFAAFLLWQGSIVPGTEPPQHPPGWDRLKPHWEYHVEMVGAWTRDFRGGTSRP